MIRIAHTADLHAQKGRMDEVLASLETLRDTSEQQEVDLIAISGDIWNAGMYATGASRFPELVEAVRSLANVAPVVMIYGTPSHDLPGSLEVFEGLQSKFGVMVLRPGSEYFLTGRTVLPGVRNDESKLLIFGIPEPSKDWLLAGKPAMGREESDAAMKEGMRQLLLGLAAERKNHPDIPCLVLYHGQIRGATMQNGQVIENAIGRDDLAMIGADYYALGDIHEPQQIGDLPMFYPGSAYPQNWGETHQAGFNLITIGGRPAGDLFEDDTRDLGIERIPYPHPQQRKICVEVERRTNGSLDYDDDGAWVERQYDGQRVWVEITGRKEVVEELDVNAECLRLKGALPGSRVTVKVLPSETVRAGAIAEQQRLEDKVATWAENSFEDLSDGIVEKARELEEQRAKEVAGGAHHWRIKSLSLRGAIGIWKGLDTDEVAIDLDDYSEGIVALVGANGKGKSTLFENMQPWPQLMTRDGALASHFRLRDSHRDLRLVDELTGDEWRFLIQINGATKTGGAEYHVYRNGAPYGDSNGRLAPYQEIVSELFGSLEMYQRSAFVSQRPTKGNPDLADATKGERKTLFRELAGLDYLQDYAEQAKARAKEIADEIQTDEGWIAATRSQVAELPVLQGNYRTHEEKVTLARQRVLELEERGQAVRGEHDALAADMEKDKALRAQREELLGRSERLTGEWTTLQGQRERLEAAVARQADAEQRIAHWEELNAEKQKIEKARNEKLEARTAALEQYNADRAAFDARRQELEEAKRAAQASLEALERDRKEAIASKERLGELLDTPRQDTCPDCGARLPWADSEAERRAKWQQQLEDSQRLIWKIDKQIPEAQDAVEAAAAAIQEQGELVAPKTPRITEDDELQRIERDMAYYEVDSARAALEEAKTASTKIESINERRAAIANELDENDGKLGELSMQINDDLPAQFQKVAERLEAVRREHADTRAQLAGLESELQSLAKQIEALEEKKAELAEREQKVEAARTDAAEWSLLQRACGPDGIQALELDALAPSISTVANSILESAYGARFMVDFQTTKMSADGKKQLEDFLIQIYDTEHGSDQELSTLSGGEAVWIKRAIYDAFGIIRDRNTGLRFLTSFQDETDGALDPEAKEAYARMLQSAHEQAGRRHTVLITHSREVQELVGQRIEMEELAEARKEAVVA